MGRCWSPTIEQGPANAGLAHLINLIKLEFPKKEIIQFHQFGQAKKTAAVVFFQNGTHL